MRVNIYTIFFKGFEEMVKSLVEVHGKQNHNLCKMFFRFSFKT